jgi:hypothetical protein
MYLDGAPSEYCVSEVLFHPARKHAKGTPYSVQILEAPTRLGALMRSDPLLVVD